MMENVVCPCRHYWVNPKKKLLLYQMSSETYLKNTSMTFLHCNNFFSLLFYLMHIPSAIKKQVGLILWSVVNWCIQYLR